MSDAALFGVDRYLHKGVAIYVAQLYGRGRTEPPC
jgi:hypothetical protein